MRDHSADSEPGFVAAFDAYQHTRVRIARLAMRPHAPASTVESATAAARPFSEAIYAIEM